MNYCPHCMREAHGDFCPHCGKSTQYKADPNRLPAGTVLQVSGGWHTYLVGAVLGQGGFGITYIALLQETGQRVALKEYFPTAYVERGKGHTIVAKTKQEAKFQKGLDDFLKEARRLAEMRSVPSVVQALDFFQANGTGYLAMEFLDGISLSQKVKQDGKIPPEELFPRIQVLMQDIEAMHNQKIIHRDIAPDNIMWMPDGRLKLIDFGCARSTEASELTVMYKPQFAPVEQYTKKNQGPWTDVYGMAATIYYCLTATVPPDAIARLDNDQTTLPSQYDVKLTEQQERSIMWGLAVQPKERPQTMAEFGSKLFEPPVKKLPDPAKIADAVKEAVNTNVVPNLEKNLKNLKNLKDMKPEDLKTWAILGGIGLILLLLLLG